MHTLEPILAEHPFFKGLQPEYLHLLVGCASNVGFNAGEFIAREGDNAKQFYMIRHGKVAIEIHDHKRGPISIQTVGEGEILGWSWLFPPYRWHFDARALDLTRAIALDGECLRKKSEQDCGLGFEFLKRFSHILTQRLEATRLQLLDVYR
jgi:CRP-like cAMP-binding protein